MQQLDLLGPDHDAQFAADRSGDFGSDPRTTLSSASLIIAASLDHAAEQEVGMPMKPATKAVAGRWYRLACAGKQVAWDVVQSLNARINHLRAMTISTPGRAKAAIGEMHRILDAIRKRDADGAYRASADHVRKVAELARNALTSGDTADQRISSRGQ